MIIGCKHTEQRASVILPGHQGQPSQEAHCSFTLTSEVHIHFLHKYWYTSFYVMYTVGVPQQKMSLNVDSGLRNVDYHE